MTNCSQDTQDINENNVIEAEKNEISFNQFKNKTGLIEFKNTFSLPIVSLKAQSKKVEKNQYTVNDFNIDTTYIKQFVVRNKTAYTFKITPKIITRKSIFNLTIYNKDGVWETSIIEMIPTDQNYKDLITGNARKFRGKMRLVYQSATYQNPINKSYAKSSGSGTGYTTVFVTGNRHCTGTGDCASGTCDNCNLCVDYYSFSLPVDGEAVEALEETPNSESQSGGGSSPNLTDPSGYVIDPNLFDLSNPKSFILLQKAETAAAFWADLSNDLKEWAIVNADEYTMILNLYLDNVSQESKGAAIEMMNSMMNNFGYSSDGFMGDGDGDNVDYSGPKQLIPKSIILNDGSTLTITFGTTQSDNKNSNNEVAVDLVNSIKFTLNLANSKLENSLKITSIYIAATTNGTHSSTSNHPRGTAVDISRINGTKMINLGGNAQVKALQEAFDDYPKIRENFGPSFKHKTLPNGSVNLNWLIAGHQDHIHVSVQSN